MDGSLNTFLPCSLKFHELWPASFPICSPSHPWPWLPLLYTPCLWIWLSEILHMRAVLAVSVLLAHSTCHSDLHFCPRCHHLKGWCFALPLHGVYGNLGYISGHGRMKNKFILEHETLTGKTNFKSYLEETWRLGRAVIQEKTVQDKESC